jgi:fucose permease
MTTPAATSPIAERQSDARSWQLAQTISYFAAFVALGLSTSSMGPTLSGLAAHTQSSLSAVSILFTVRSLGYLIGSLLGGRLYDRIRGHPIMGVSFVLMAAMLFLAPMASQLWLLMAIMLLLSVADGAIDVGCNTLLVWVHGGKVGPYMNALHFFFGVGAFLAPIFVAQAILMTGTFNGAYWLIALLVLPMAVIMFRLPSPAHPATHAHGEDARPQTNMLLVVLIAVFFFLYVGMEIGFGGWIASYAVSVGFGDVAAAAVLTSAFWGALTLGRLIAIPIGARISPRVIMYANLLGCIVSTLVILLGGGAPASLWIGTLGVGLFMAPMFATMISFAETRMRITGKITSIFLTGSSIGGMTLPWLIGQLFDVTGPNVMVWMVLIATLATTAMFAVINAVGNQTTKDTKITKD